MSAPSASTTSPPIPPSAAAPRPWPRSTTPRPGIIFEEDGERFSLHWLRCRSRADLARRTAALKAIADASYGLVGRSPDHVAGMVTGLAMRPQILDALRQGSGDALLQLL